MLVYGKMSKWYEISLFQHKYGNNLIESHKYNTPAKFTIDQYGETIVHSPSDSKMRIIKRTPTITSFNFLDLEDENALILENIEKELEDF